MKTFVGCLVVCLLFSVAAARFQRSKIQDEVHSGYNLRNDLKHTYYVLIKQGDPSLASAEALSTDFSKRLGDDSNVHIIPASQVIIVNF
jgi:hypothetical protein